MDANPSLEEEVEELVLQRVVVVEELVLRTSVIGKMVGRVVEWPTLPLHAPKSLAPPKGVGGTL